MTSSSLAESAPRPAFLITIDTEGDNVWSGSNEITTKNAQFLPRFQELCERYGFRPTYLTNYEMAIDRTYQEFALDLTRRGAGEVGLHVHAWNSPPIHNISPDDGLYKPYITEYPDHVVKAKVDYLTDILEHTFEQKMLSHRGGRWAFNAVYAQALDDRGYRVDCSVTPHVSWRGHRGAPDGGGGPDFTAFPQDPYFIDILDISRSGASQLLELPMTIMAQEQPLHLRLGRQLLNKPSRRILWMRPNGRNIADLLYVVERAEREARPYLQFMLHSSEFMPGGSPTFLTERHIEILYEHLEVLFDRVSRTYQGATLAEFSSNWRSNSLHAGSG